MKETQKMKDYFKKSKVYKKYNRERELEAKEAAKEKQVQEEIVAMKEKYMKMMDRYGLLLKKYQKENEAADKMLKDAPKEEKKEEEKKESLVQKKNPPGPAMTATGRPVPPGAIVKPVGQSETPSNSTSNTPVEKQEKKPLKQIENDIPVDHNPTLKLNKTLGIESNNSTKNSSKNATIILNSKATLTQSTPVVKTAVKKAIDTQNKKMPTKVVASVNSAEKKTVAAKKWTWDK